MLRGMLHVHSFPYLSTLFGNSMMMFVTKWQESQSYIHKLCYFTNCMCEFVTYTLFPHLYIDPILNLLLTFVLLKYLLSSLS